jgi:hypothetical protein
MKNTEIKSIQSVTRALVMRALGWDELQYGHYIFDKGIEYLQNYIGDDEEIISLYSRHPLFWKWYRNHWHNRDAEFLQNCKNLTQVSKVAEYHYVHNMKCFKYKPHRVIMDMSMYADVIYPSTHQEGVTV